MPKPKRIPQDLKKMRTDLSRQHGVSLVDMGKFYTHPKINFTREQMIEHEIQRETQSRIKRRKTINEAGIRAGAEQNVNRWLSQKKK